MMIITRSARSQVHLARYMSAASSAAAVMARLGLVTGDHVNSGLYNGEWREGSGEIFTSYNPANNKVLGRVKGASLEEYDQTVQLMQDARAVWTETPAPLRGEVVRRIGDELRKKRNDLGALVSLETGKILAEGIGEVQEAIDMCDFACGLSRMLNGTIIPSERAGHFMMERYHPLNGNVAIISAFNFPVAVFFWNATLSLVTGNCHLWKPADSTTLCAVASARIIGDVLTEMKLPTAVATLICGTGHTIGVCAKASNVAINFGLKFVLGDAIVSDRRNALVSFTGSTRVGKGIGEKVSSRFGRTILELGGNNAMVIMDDADLDMALNAVVFASVGTAGQRCTTLRRLIIHKDVYDSFKSRLVSAVKNVKIGDPLDADTLCGPLHSKAALKAFLSSVEEIKSEGGSIIAGGNGYPKLGGLFVEPTIVEGMAPDSPIVQQETFAPILYLFKVDDLNEAVHVNNAVPQGLSSSLFTRDLRNLFRWTGPNGSDCGIVNVNIGTSGAEIGGAFGGDKESGGGREAGSDVWKQYCRRLTCTVNHSESLPLSQGIVFKTLP